MNKKSSTPGYLLAGGAAATVLAVLLSHPTPGPGPNPGPAPVPFDPTSWHLTAVTDNANRTPDQAAILDSDDLWSWLGQKKVGWWVVDKDAASYIADGYDKILTADGILPPALVLESPDRTQHRTVAFPASVDALKQWVMGSPHTGPPFIEFNGERRYLTYLPSSESRLMAPRGGDFSEVSAPIPRANWREINNRAKFPPDKWIFDQDGIGACVGNGSTSALMKARALAGYSYVRLAPGATYAQINGGRDQGASIPDSLTVLQQTGTISAETLGSDQKPFYKNQLPAGWQKEAARFRIEEAYKCANFDEACTAVQLGYVVVFGMMVDPPHGTRFNTFTSEGVAGASPGPGNHCLSADGLHKLASGEWALDTCNSWGQTWGPWKNGRCYLIEPHFQQGDVPDFYAVKTAVVDPQDPLHPPKKVIVTPEEILGIVTGPASWLVFNEPEKPAKSPPPCGKLDCDCPCQTFPTGLCTCKTPPPGVKPPNAFTARKQAMREGKKLAVFLHKEPVPMQGCVTVRDDTLFPEEKRPGVYLLTPSDGEEVGRFKPDPPPPAQRQWLQMALPQEWCPPRG